MFQTKLVFYFLIVVFSLGANNIVILLVLLELLSWIFSRILTSYVSIKYLMVQNYFVFLLLLGIIFKVEAVRLAFFLKIGLPPFHLWFFVISLGLTGPIFLMFRTFHKMVPLLTIVKLVSLPMALLVVGVSSVLLFQVAMLYYALFCSSLIHSGWILLSLMIRTMFFIAYFILYVGFLRSMLFGMKFLRYSNVSQFRLVRLVWLGVSGFPPFTFFWLKAFVIFSVLVFFGDVVVGILLFSSILALTSYFRVFHIGLKLGSGYSFVMLPILTFLIFWVQLY